MMKNKNKKKWVKPQVKNILVKSGPAGLGDGSSIGS
jgi:hypothetical protein